MEGHKGDSEWETVTFLLLVTSENIDAYLSVKGSADKFNHSTQVP